MRKDRYLVTRHRLYILRKFLKELEEGKSQSVKRLPRLLKMVDSWVDDELGVTLAKEYQAQRGKVFNYDTLSWEKTKKRG